MMGEAKSSEIAAKAPAAAITSKAWSGTGLRASEIEATAIPEPRAISGASGPTTVPRPIEARPASATPGTVIGLIGPLACRPSAGRWPPFPGRRTIANATISPAIASTGSDHHSGGPWW